MIDRNELYQSFKNWVEIEVRPKFQDCEFGISDQQIENIAWLKLNTKGTISGIKLWSTGDYYCEILTLEQDDPDMALSGKLPQEPNYSATFFQFLKRISEIDRNSP